jgi:hypothetical protein
VRLPFVPLLALAAVACTPPVPARSTPAPDSPAAPVADPLRGPWELRPAVGERTYSIALEGTLVSRVDTLERVDTLRAQVRATLSRVTDDALGRLAGLLTEYGTSSGDSVPFTPLPGVLLPLPVSATPGPPGAQPAWRIAGGGDCSAAAAAMQPLRDLWVGAPSRLAVDQSWQDSTSYTICRDSIPLAVRSIRRFTVLGAEPWRDEVVLRVARATHTRIAGEGTQFGEPLSIAAEGMSRIEILVSLAGGEVVRGAGDAELAMAMTGRRRLQELRQRTRIEISSP